MLAAILSNQAAARALAGLHLHVRCGGVPLACNYSIGSVAGSPKKPSTVVSKRVITRT